jgi:molybdopterin-guanine dinucleotide biosynthesis protein A
VWDDITAVILTGGRSARMGGGDKTQSLIGTETSLDLLVGSLPDHITVVVVGPQRPSCRPVTLCREDPPFGGPVAALHAALAVVETPYVLVIAGDMPFAGRVLPALIRAWNSHDAVVPVDSRGRRQHLCCLAQVESLRAAMERLPSPQGASMTSVLELLDVQAVLLNDANDHVLADFDTPEELAALRLWKGHPLDPLAGDGSRTGDHGEPVGDGQAAQHP